MKKRVSVYIDEGIWGHVKDEAWRLRISASSLFEKLVRGELPYKGHIAIDSDDFRGVVLESAKEIADNRELMEAQAKIEKIQKERGVSSVLSYSKDRQLGKGGGK